MSQTSRERSVLDFVTGYRTKEHAIEDYKETRFFCRIVTLFELLICCAILAIKHFIF